MHLPYLLFAVFIINLLCELLLNKKISNKMDILHLCELKNKLNDNDIYIIHITYTYI